ncbi:hypothetical protein CF651_14155 [Paenibacillus rigui]|uniref:DUF302 domain-containing protein n=1 Tax=Paenibacillus rigui TaxID=554312 RepID=A0A229URB3_9BACL|nr:DUF302 domain-containing protein [Paenibacillus rigui]OXM85725.1 hypothetical protein CF651_14155 [Paenibacillus rigui]
MFHYTVETAKSVQEAIASLGASLQEEKFGILWQLNMKEKLNEKGLDYDPNYYILEVCNPVEAKRALSENPLIGYVLPCKITVYEKDGRTSIGLPRPTALLRLAGGEAMQPLAEDVEQRLIRCIDRSL